MDLSTNRPASKKGGDGERYGRYTWQVVGLTAEEAEKKIKEDKPELDVQVVGPDHMVTEDFRSDRVRIFVDSEGKVIRAPTVG